MGPYGMMSLEQRQRLDMELQRMAQREQLQRQRAEGARYARNYLQSRARATGEAPKQVDGIKLNSNGSITIQGTTYSRSEFRAKLQETIEAMQSDPASAYHDRRNPMHQQTVAEISLAYKFLNNELSPQDETQVIQEWQEAEAGSDMANTLQPHQEIAQIVSSPEGKIALQRARTGQPLDAAQKQIVQRHNELEAQNNTVARREQASKGGTMSIRPPRSIGSDVQAWLNNPHKVQRQQLAAEFKTKTLANPDHDYWHPERGTLCDNAKLGMKIAYEVAETGDCHGVQIGPDGSISEGE